MIQLYNILKDLPDGFWIRLKKGSYPRTLKVIIGFTATAGLEYFHTQELTDEFLEHATLEHLDKVLQDSINKVKQRARI